MNAAAHDAQGLRLVVVWCCGVSRCLGYAQPDATCEAPNIPIEEAVDSNYMFRFLATTFVTVSPDASRVIHLQVFT